jgi:dTDP-4-dehydrorhamnose reductase
MAQNIIDSIYINSIFPHELAEFCGAKNIKLIHITTDCVYSGFAGNYNELSAHDALDDYGKSKSLGEAKNAMVIRTSIIGEEVHKNASLISWVKSMAGKDANGFLNHSWNGITTTQYGKICKKIIEKDLHKKDLFHCYSPKSVSKYELLQLINKHWNLNININPTNDKMSIDRTLSSIKDLNSVMDIPDLDLQLKEIAS